MDDSGMTRNSSRQRLLAEGDEANARRGLAGVAKHTLGLILLLCVVFLWTLSNFLGSVRITDHLFSCSVQDETDERYVTEHICR
jgi:solute carrier family 35 protein F5